MEQYVLQRMKMLLHSHNRDDTEAPLQHAVDAGAETASRAGRSVCDGVILAWKNDAEKVRFGTNSNQFIE